MSDKLQLKHLTPYLPYGLKVSVKPNYGFSGHRTDSTIFTLTGLQDDYLKVDSFGGFYPISDFKLLLIPLSELKSFMPSILKNLSEIDISDCTFDENEYEEDINQWWCNAFDGDRVIACLTFDGNAFYIQYWSATSGDGFNLYEPQYEALQQLAKHHLDYQFLIEKGLALNKNTIK